MMRQNNLLIIAILFVLSGPSIVLAETYAEAVSNTKAHAQNPSFTWLPTSSTAGPIANHVFSITCRNYF